MWLLLGGLLVFGLGYSVFDFIQRKRRRSQPIVNVPARVFAKREEVGGGNGISIHTSYYLTFELAADGSRRELAVDGPFYSRMREDETGYLILRGTECLDFVRVSQPVTEAPPPPTLEWVCDYCNAVVPHSQSKCPACGSIRRVTSPLPE